MLPVTNTSSNWSWDPGSILQLLQLSSQAYEMIFLVLFPRLEGQGETVSSGRTIPSKETFSQAPFLPFPHSAVLYLKCKLGVSEIYKTHLQPSLFKNTAIGFSPPLERSNDFYLRAHVKASLLISVTKILHMYLWISLKGIIFPG